MKKTTAKILSIASMIVLLGATNSALAGGHGGGGQTEENRLFQLEIEKALDQRAAQRRAAQKKSPTSTFVGFRKTRHK